MKRKNRGDVEEDEMAGDREEEVQIRRRINFTSGSENNSDDEIFFDTQAHKRRKMSKDIEKLKRWMEGKLQDVATKNQTQILIDNVVAIGVYLVQIFCGNAPSVSPSYKWWYCAISVLRNSPPKDAELW